MPIARFRAGGVLRPNDYYVPRLHDARALQLLRDGELVTVLAPRQTGKSSLKVRLQASLRANSWCGVLDLTAISTSTSPDALFDSLGDEVVRSIERGGGPGAPGLPPPGFPRRPTGGPLARGEQTGPARAAPGRSAQRARPATSRRPRPPGPRSAT